MSAKNTPFLSAGFKFEAGSVQWTELQPEEKDAEYEKYRLRVFVKETTTAVVYHVAGSPSMSSSRQYLGKAIKHTKSLKREKGS